MEIGSHRILDKIEELLQKAKSSPTEEAAEKYVTAIHALCEVIMEGHGERPAVPPAAASQIVKASQSPSGMSAQAAMPQAPPAKIEGANGGSLFDF
ncbi:YwdI family protein [Peribacillus sp. SCS-37]|uniref:YwdI family protein n=1 Tax=Paraperibacillus esterisolvens TaxID=3115296 RepID=UPI0039060CC4